MQTLLSFLRSQTRNVVQPLEGFDVLRIVLIILDDRGKAFGKVITFFNTVPALALVLYSVDVLDGALD